MTELTYIGTRKNESGEILYLYRRENKKLVILKNELVPVLIGTVMEVEEPKHGSFVRSRIRLLQVRYDAMVDQWKEKDGQVINNGKKNLQSHRKGSTQN